ncbi:MULTISPECIES: tRNA pseudouridine(38-40) synthase TruA [unclassified Nitratiruptor]|uniref:tRNA pseudouridine(38-40) synthase TruA n=1 Tax=unclassified Nitratiruptor TaxID=2624044 RepID=UPI001915D5F5|nr:MULTISPECIES: tRNA pseudouridine(38-40) synthase TruA [unclassified Nitratiruptor]BCD60169.1 tRNA pseudouridine38-40 synthase [Nitratiruptor sp. YY08-10]BCD64343.1 tRNA pseudouridine38-40 synthase [Nitratiruptor sp. YY08-14]
MRIKAVISYDGSRFDGFQIQKHTTNTVMHHLYNALHRVGIESKIVGSGRTDKGVHATAQVIHFDLPSYWSDLERLQTRLNNTLHPYIHIKRVVSAPNDFHARYSAKRRAYRYLLKKSKPSVFENAYVHYVSNLDIETIKKNISLFEGQHDFAYFMKTGSDTKSSLRRIFKTALYEKDDLYVLYFEGDGFLRAQIRLIMDALIKLGKGELKPEQIIDQLACKERYTSTLAPPNGLYLCKIIY